MISKYIHRVKNTLLIISIGLLSYIGYISYEIYSKPLMEFSTASEFKIHKAETIRQVAQRMHESGYIRSSEVFVYAFLAHNNETNLYSGNYIIYPHDTLFKFIQRVSKAQVLQEAFTIVEGWTWKKLSQELSKDKRLVHSSEKTIMQYFTQIDSSTKLFTTLEGVFLPDTYHFAAGVRDIDVLAHALTAKQRYLQENWKNRKEGLLINTEHQALVVASLIESESRYPPEFNKISSVIHNRLQKNMPLQIDAAVLYGRGAKSKGPLTVKDLRKDTRFNTYTRRGLPPAPIAYPSKKAILAALHPSDDDDLFYVVMPNGRHYFSKTYKEHKSAIKRYLKGRV